MKRDKAQLADVFSLAITLWKYICLQDFIPAPKDYAQQDILISQLDLRASELLDRNFGQLGIALQDLGVPATRWNNIAEIFSRAITINPDRRYRCVAEFTTALASEFTATETGA